MSLETATYISDLVTSNPTASDPKSQGDDHIRLLKSTTKTTFPAITGVVLPTHVELNYVQGVTSPIQAQINAKGAIAGQAWTGTQDFTGSTLVAPTKGNVAGQAWTGTQDFTAAASVSVPTPVASANAATKGYVDAQAFSAALPSQAGNAGKFVTTDGTSESWQPVVNLATFFAFK